MGTDLGGRSIRELSRRQATVRVLVTVKASPQPSAAYGDTVCVAGTLLVGVPRWIRLYPVPFRYLEGNSQFAKYDIIEVQLLEATHDQRPESAKINTESIRVLEHLDGWPARAPYVEGLPEKTMCRLRRDAQVDLNATSLGGVRPLTGSAPWLTFEDHGPWSTAQQQTVDALASQDPLFGETTRPASLEPPPLVAKLNYRCREAGCRGHSPSIIDWELTALQRHLRGRPRPEIESEINERFLQRMFLNDTDPIIFVGNQANVQRRAGFTVLGVYYPKRLRQDTLF